MQVSCDLPLSVASFVWQPHPDAFALTVICKAAWTLEQGVSPLAATPDPPLLGDLYWQDRPAASLRAPSDLVPFKRRVDVLLAGHAHAPRGQRARSLTARLVVGTVDKSIAVFGDRYWMPDGRTSGPAPFTNMPLLWERAAGGPTTWNPVGVPAPVSASARPQPFPNLEPVGFVRQNPTQVSMPIGFGPLAPSWPTRTMYLHRHRATFSHGAWFKSPLPADLDPAYFNSAPPDQQLELLPEQTQIYLEHLHPEIPRLSTVIEDIRPRALVTRLKAAPEEVWLRCDTLFIDSDQGRCVLTWRATVQLRHPQEKGIVLVTPTRGSAAVQSAPAPEALFEEPTGAELRIEEPKTFDIEDEETTDFASRRAPALHGMSIEDEETRTQDSKVAPPVAAPLPFHTTPLSAAAPAGPGVAPQGPVIEDEQTLTNVPELASEAAPSLPFQSSAPQPFQSPTPLPLQSPPQSPVPIPFQSPTPLPLQAPTHAPSVGGPSPSRAAPPPLSLEQYTRVKIELWGGETSLHDALERHGIDEIAWRIHERWQADAFAAEAREGRCDLALALVAAFESAQDLHTV